MHYCNLGQHQWKTARFDESTCRTFSASPAEDHSTMVGTDARLRPRCDPTSDRSHANPSCFQAFLALRMATQSSLQQTATSCWCEQSCLPQPRNSHLDRACVKVVTYMQSSSTATERMAESSEQTRRHAQEKCRQKCAPSPPLRS